MTSEAEARIRAAYAATDAARRAAAAVTAAEEAVALAIEARDHAVAERAAIDADAHAKAIDAVAYLADELKGRS